jgi:nucleotide-binding universal stress UspA family protein
MYKRILIPTDGSELSVAAIKQAVTLAKAVKAKVTGMTVSAPFHTFALDPLLVSDIAEEYQKDIDGRAERYLGVVRDAASFAGVPRGARAATLSSWRRTAGRASPPCCWAARR